MLQCDLFAQVYYSNMSFTSLLQPQIEMQFECRSTCKKVHFFSKNLSTERTVLFAKIIYNFLWIRICRIKKQLLKRRYCRVRIILTNSTALLLMHAHLRGMQLRPTCVTLHRSRQNELLLEPEWPINANKYCFKRCSYITKVLSAKVENNQFVY